MELIFNGTKLPDPAIFLDVAAAGKVSPNLDETTSVWFWRFSTCHGLSREAPSEEVIENCQRLIRYLELNKESTIPVIAVIFKEAPQSIWSQWIECLNMIIRLSRSEKISRWIAVNPQTAAFKASYSLDNSASRHR